MKTIVAAVDFSDSTAGVLKAAREQAEALGAALHVVHVMEPEPAYTAYGFTPDEFPAMHVFQEEARKRARTRLESLKPETAAAEAVLLEGTPLHGILEYVDKVAADLVVIGTHGHGAITALLLGSVAEGMVRKAVVPTLVIPTPKKD